MRPKPYAADAQDVLARQMTPSTRAVCSASVWGLGDRGLGFRVVLV